VSATFRLWIRLRREHLDRLLAEGAALSTRPLRERAELTALATRLRAPEPITPAGAARAHRLLRTPADEPAALWERAWDTTDVLDDHAQ
jgi:hypothetical protein